MAAGLLILLAAIWVAWLGLRPQTMGDYPADYAPAMNALLAGHIGAFFAHLPTNGAGGSVLLRAPFAWIGQVLGGSQHAIFRFGALGCALVAAGVALLLAGRRRAQQSATARVTLVGLFVLAPGILDAIQFGHPEEGLGASLCILAVVLAAEDRAQLAGVILGLAIINKPWGVLAVFPTLLAARGGRLRLLVAAASIAAAWTAVAYISDPAHFSRTVLGATTSIVAHPVDVWWPLARLHPALGVTPAYFPPSFVSAHARELAVLLSVPLGVLVARRRRDVGTCFALLALLFLLRCALDPSNHVYYQVPFVLALAAWEARTRGLPILALLSVAGFWFIFHTVAGTGSLTAQFVCYIALIAPLAVLLGRTALLTPSSIVLRDDRHSGRRGIPGSVTP